MNIDVLYLVTTQVSWDSICSL